MQTGLSAKKIIIASYTHQTNGEFTVIGGPALGVRDYLKDRCARLICVWQPLPISESLSIIIESYGKNKSPKLIKLPVVAWPFGRKKAVSALYVFLKLRDIFSVFISFLIYGAKYDVFIGVEALNVLMGIILRRLGLVKKVVYYNLEYGINRLGNPFLNSIFHFLDRLAFSNCDVVWVLSQEMLTQRSKIGTLDKRDIPRLVVPIGINFGRIKRLPLEAINRKSIAYLGVLEELQGVQLIIEALPEIIKKIPGVRLTVIGSGTFEDNLKRKVKELALDGYVDFTGIISDEEVQRLLSKCAVGIAPYVDDPDSSTRFTDPTKPKTYVSCGLPVIITKVPKMAFDIASAGAGIAINYNKEELVKAVSTMLCDEASYKQYRENAIKFAARYDWESILDTAFGSSGLL